jgi:hypothetical protein
MKSRMKAAQYMAYSDDTKKEALVQAFRRGAKALHAQGVQSIVDQTPQECIVAQMMVDIMNDANKVIAKRKAKALKKINK